MSQFIRTGIGYINLSHVVRVRMDAKPSGEQGNADLWYLDGDGLQHTRAFLRGDLDETTAPMVPASPGYFVVTVEQEPPHEMHHLDVIAWRVEGDIAWPVVAGEPQVNDLSSDWAILYPSGTVERIFDGRYDSTEEFQRFVAEKYAERKQSLMTGTAQFTFADYTSHGWTEEQLVTAGLMKREKAA